ncbi:hypothetical protein L0664_14010 [Octadecabacter sp. G9-8]|uniref:SecDF P1 head subdomain domain-containing protein n=1 Tax=Octadecabacter dasysiphoniae TaxID=2909341 RepID=A0ABS9CY65_9RHOB|nr:hypothetical protein [Octadecabacter dasysiphoniae]MCF2872187.1 hypothetical protein [Octadecabacter dasysiphoniae]
MIRGALIAFSLLANTAAAQGVSAARLVEMCGGTRFYVEPQDDLDADGLDVAQAVIGARLQDRFAGLLDYTHVEGGQIVVSLLSDGQVSAADVAVHLAPFDLGFHDVVSRGDTGTLIAQVGQVIAPSVDDPDVAFVLDALDVSMIADAGASYDYNGRPGVNSRFTRQGGQLFADYTAARVGAPFAILLNGTVMSAPVVQEPIVGGTGIITATFTVEQADKLASMMRSGALGEGLVIVAQTSVDGSDPSADFCP